MTGRPRVSVVTIFLDAERFLQEAIDSVAAQSFTDWELLLVDDGSTDGSSAIARRAAAAAPDRVRYLEHPGHANLGMSASRNAGIRASRGEYVALLDADDVWQPDKLERQVAILDARPDVAMAYGPAEWWYGWTGEPADAARDFVHHLGVPPDAVVGPPALLLALLDDEGVSPCTCSMLVRREVLERVGGFEERFRGLYEDQAMCAKICVEYPVFASSECSYRYRQHPDSACAVAERSGARAPARTVFLDWLASHLSERGVSDPTLWSALERQRRRSSGSTGPRLAGLAGVVRRGVDRLAGIAGRAR